MIQQLETMVGKLVSLCRYPVKSMLGEEVTEIAVSERGLHGDRAFALIDCATGKVGSAKNPRLWPNLFGHAASFAHDGSDLLSQLCIRLPNGEQLENHSQLNERLSQSVGRDVELAGLPEAGLPKDSAKSEGYWPDDDWLAHRNQVFEFALPAGTFFDCSPIHIVTSSTLARLQAQSPASCFAAARFRPNLVVETIDQSAGFMENKWLGRELVIGEVTMRIIRSSPRCIMTTLRQTSLPHDSSILRTAVQANGGNVGVYADVVQSGQIRTGDSVHLR